MVLILFIVTLLSGASWEAEHQEITEKSLDTILDELIEETIKSNEKEMEIENLNNSRIIYIKPDNGTRHQILNVIEPQMDPLHSSAYEDFDDLVHKIQDSEKKGSARKKISNSKPPSQGDIIVQLGQSPETDIVDHVEETKDLELSGTYMKPLLRQSTSVNNIFSKYTAEIGSKILHKYPEIILNKITANKNRMVEDGNPVTTGLQGAATASDSISIKRKKEVDEYSARTLDTIIKILLNSFSKKGIARTSNHLSRENSDRISKSDFMHVDRQNDFINEVPLAYPQSTAGMFYGGPTQYGNVAHSIIHRPRSTSFEPNLQLMEWAGRSGNTGPTRRLNRITVIPKPYNIYPRITRLYRRPYYRQYRLL